MAGLLPTPGGWPTAKPSVGSWAAPALLIPREPTPGRRRLGPGSRAPGARASRLRTPPPRPPPPGGGRPTRMCQAPRAHSPRTIVKFTHRGASLPPGAGVRGAAPRPQPGGWGAGRSAGARGPGRPASRFSCLQRFSVPWVAARPARRADSRPTSARLHGLLSYDRTALPGPPAADRDRTVSRRSKPSSRTTLIGEQTNPWEPLHNQDVMSRHRGAKRPRR
jgi:hypothetical protein